MAIDLTPAEREIGKKNFQGVVGSQYEANEKQQNRRQFMKGMVAAGGAVPIGAAAYFGYKKLEGGAVKAGLIGSGDEGGVLVGEHNPDFLEFIGVADIRPYNRRRIFEGERAGPRKGFNRVYGSKANNIKVYNNYKELLDNPEIKIVVIALPLHLHAPVAIEAMKKGKHVLCEKLMAWNIAQCKEMIRVAEETDRCLSIGHQRHYSMLYAHAVEVLNAGEIGDIKHIRAFWHRNNALPKLDKNGVQLMEELVDHRTGKPTGIKLPALRDGWRPDIPADDRLELEAKVRSLGYQSLEELCRWRLYEYIITKMNSSVMCCEGTCDLPCRMHLALSASWMCVEEMCCICHHKYPMAWWLSKKHWCWTCSARPVPRRGLIDKRNDF